MSNELNINDRSFQNILEGMNLKNKKISLFDDSFLIFHSHPENDADIKETMMEPVRLEFILFVLVLEGEAEIICDHQEFKIQEKSIFFAFPGSIIQMIPIQNGEAYCVMSDQSFNGQITLPMQKILPHANQLQQVHTLSLSESQTDFLLSQIQLIQQTIALDKELLFYKETVRSVIASFTYHFFSLHTQHVAQEEEKAVQVSRNEMLFRQFIELLRENYLNDRSVKFYADRLNLTPKYFSIVIKKVSGRIPSQWINEFVISEIKNQLRYSTRTAQEISNLFHFPNQSFFGKFFKHHTGMTPIEYRGK